MPDNYSMIDIFRPGLETLAVFDDIDNSRLRPSTLRFAADVTSASDRSTFNPWLKTPVALTPGEPIPVKWEFEAGTSLLGDQVTARIDYEGTVIYTSAPVVLKGGKSGLQRATLFIDGAMAKKFYLLGYRTLTLTVLGNGEAPGPVKRRTYWNVVSPIGVQSFWNWDGLPERHEDWKTDYNLPGRFINATPFTAMQTAHIRLVEDDANWHDSVEKTNDYFDQWDAGVVNPGVEATHSFPVVGKRFFWLSRAGYSRVSYPLFRYYHYRVFIKLSDIYGNDYDEFADVVTFSEDSDDLRVQVEVSKTRQILADLAAHLFELANALTVAAVLSAWFPIGSAALKAAAVAAAGGSVALGEAALDPPAPDPDFFARVEVLRPALPQSAGEEMQPIIDWIAAACTISAVDSALIAIEGKILGAEQAQAEQAIDQQLQRYYEVRQEAVSEYNRLLSLQDAVQRALENVQQQVQQIMSQNSQPQLLLPDDVRMALQQQQLPPEFIDAMESRLANAGEFAVQPDLVGLPSLTGRAMTMLMRYMLRYDPMTHSFSQL